jgi:hypothetical protein
MLRKFLSILLVASWFVLSAIDMLEDLDLANYLKVQAAESPGFAGFGRTANVANNIVENGTRHIAGAEVSLIIPPAWENVGFQPHDNEARTPRKNLKIYKLRSAFLI